MKESRPIFFIVLRVSLLHLLVLTPTHAQPTTQPSPLTNGNGTTRNFDPSTAIIIMVIFMAFFFVGFFSIYIRQCSSETTPPPSAAASPRRLGLDTAVIETFPVFLYSEVKEIKIGRGPLECAVCISEFEDDETLRLLPKCNHVFHPDCIDLWLSSHVTCPVCRFDLTPTKAVSDDQSRGGQNNIMASPPSSANEQGTTAEPAAEAVAVIRREITGKFPRSHSTGHSLILPGENVERYTLRLPEEARRMLLQSAKLKRARSFNVIFAGEGSLRRGYRGGGGGGEGSSRGRRLMGRFERWMFMRTPPYVIRGGGGGGVGVGGSLKCVKNESGDGDCSSHGGSRNVLKWLNRKVDGVESSSRSLVRPCV